MVESSYDTVSDVRRGADVPLPEISENDSFILLKLDDDAEGARVTLYNVSTSEALDALMGLVMAIGT